MCKGLIGKKLGMTNLFSSDSKYLPVTVVQAGPCVVIQIKTSATDGYNALQLGFEEKKESRIKKPLKGHFKKSGGEACFAYLREFPVDDPSEYSLGQTITLDSFKVGDSVDVTGTIKGRGFAGVIKRHGFHGGGATHGSGTHRAPGSIGSSAWPSRVVKGKKLPGHYGAYRKTVRNLEIVDIKSEENLIMIKGALPGFRSGLVVINKPKIAK
ncbi:MAG: 50S ribosomal protein L3 [Deltaproteobacteria bacterium CG1_02_45_11]|nr:MAG: 50S ribosomal protein L3 [Deltaproteobacteria bacterium CG1_02_45_11]